MAGQTFSAGEWVRTETGEVGKVVYTARLTVFVHLMNEPAEATVKAFLESQLTRIARPAEDEGQSEPPGSAL